MIVFTICSKNFIAYALALQTSLEEHNTNVRFYLVLCDDVGELDIPSFNFEFIVLEDLGIPKLSSMFDRYNITELNTSIKPFVFSYLFDRHPGESVTYLDPDILVASELVELQDALVQGADCVLTPHILEPAEFSEMDDMQFLRYGIYNLGFCTLRDTPGVRRIVSWWGRRLETHCLIDLEAGIFVDQKWADLFPALIEKTVILRHPGYNVAYWNLSQRKVRVQNGVWTSNGLPLRFFHFSGNKINDRNIFSRHSGLYRVTNIGDLSILLDIYRKNVLDHGHSYFSTLQYGFNWNGERGVNVHTPLVVNEPKAKGSRVAPYLPIFKTKSAITFDGQREKMPDIIARRTLVESDVLAGKSSPFQLPGYCACCLSESSFSIDITKVSCKNSDEDLGPQWRQTMVCEGCGLPSNARSLMQVFRQLRKPAMNSRVLLSGQNSELKSWLISRGQHGEDPSAEQFAFDADTLASDGLNNDLCNDINGDEKFDSVIALYSNSDSSIGDYVIKKWFCCLEPGGKLLLSVSFAAQPHEQVGGVVLCEAEQNVLDRDERKIDNIDVENSMLYCKIVVDLETAGFEKAEVLSFWSSRLGYLGNCNFLISAHKPKVIAGAFSEI